MIYDLDKLVDKKVFGTEGSGHQVKVWINNNKQLVKLNSKYREATKEESASKLALAGGLQAVKYSTAEFNYQGKKRIGCICDTFLNTGDVSYTLYDLIRYLQVGRNTPTLEFFTQTIQIVSSQTKIDQSIIYRYIITILTFDYLILNTDRHLSNIEFILNTITNTWRPAPIFDCGQAFLCRDGVVSNSEYKNLVRKYKSRPFSTNPEKNLIDIKTAQSIAYNLMLNINRIGGIDSLNIRDFHKNIFKQRYQQLMNLK